MADVLIAQLKKCAKCGTEKSVEQFGYTRTVRGTKLKRATCRVCYNAHRRTHYCQPSVHAEKLRKRHDYQLRTDVIERRKVLRSTPESKARERATMLRYKSKPEVNIRIRSQRDEHIAKPIIRGRMVLLAAKARAEKKGLSFDLTNEWISAKVLAGVCELTGISFNYSRPKKGWRKNPFTPSVDRISSSLGYTQDNCRLVLTAVNIALGQWGDEVFEKIASAFVSKKRSRYEPCIFLADREVGSGRSAHHQGSGN